VESRVQSQIPRIPRIPPPDSGCNCETNRLTGPAAACGYWNNATAVKAPL